MKYGQFIKALKDKGVKVEDRTRHLKLSYGGKQTGCKSIRRKSILRCF